MTRLISALQGESGGSLVSLKWRPPADVYRTAQGWLVKLELAGVDANDVQLEMQGRTVTVRGRRRDVTTAEGHRQYAMEIAYCEFERSVDLPCDVGVAQVVTEHRDGMLMVFIAPEVA